MKNESLLMYFQNLLLESAFQYVLESVLPTMYLGILEQKTKSKKKSVPKIKSTYQKMKHFFICRQILSITGIR